MPKPEPILLDAFLESLASRTPTPGGGAAAAVMGGIGAALAAMAARYSVKKSNPTDVNASAESFAARCDGLRRQLLELAEEDCVAYEAVRAAYGASRSTPEERLARDAAVRDASRAALEVPARGAALCADALDALAAIAPSLNKNLVTDVGGAGLALAGAVASLILNVRVNAAALPADEVIDVERRVAELERRAAAAGQTIAGVVDRALA